MTARLELGIAAAVAVAALLLWVVTRGDRNAPEAPNRVADTRSAASQPAADVGAPTPRPRADVPAPPADAGAAAVDDEPDELDGDAIAAAWASVDLEAVRKALPDNIYWQTGAPTSDESVIEARAAERARWNVEYGKVLSGTASEAEIRAYYDHRARLSGDYVEFATYLLDHYGSELHERDVGLLHLARRLHLARLEEIPRQVEEAFARKRQQDEARAQWLADEAAFGRNPPPQE